MFIWFLGIVGWIVGSFIVGQIVFWVGLLVMPIYSVLLVYYNLAPRDMIFTFVKEGTGIVVTRGGEFDKIIISWKERTIDPNTWDVIEAPDMKIGLFGGLRYWGVPPFQKIFTYAQSWTHLHEDGEIKEHKEPLDYVLLKQDFYIFRIPLTEKKAAQDINGISVDVSLVIPMQTVNAYEALFGPRRWLAAISGTVKPVLKRFVAKFRYKEDLFDMRAGEGIEELQMAKGIIKEENGEITSVSKRGDDLRDLLWGELKNVFPGARIQMMDGEEYLRIYGVLLKRKGTDILEAETSPEYRKMVTAEYEAKQKAKMTVIEGEAKGRAIINKVIDPVWKIAKQLAGIMKKDEKLTKKEKKKISSYLEEAWSNYLETVTIEAIKSTDKVIVTEGKGIGKTVGRDVAREMIREKISRKNREEETEE